MIAGRNIPLKKYTDNVRTIVTMSEGKKYPMMLVTMPSEDIKTALKIMKEYGALKGKQELCYAELKMRKAVKEPDYGAYWEKWFTAEWNYTTQMIRKACGM